jgi:hypothetical protein
VKVEPPPGEVAFRDRLRRANPTEISAPTGAWTARALGDKFPYHRGGTAVRQGRLSLANRRTTRTGQGTPFRKGVLAFAIAISETRLRHSSGRLGQPMQLLLHEAQQAFTL